MFQSQGVKVMGILAKICLFFSKKRAPSEKLISVLVHYQVFWQEKSYFPV